jgi:nitric oxide reductase NorD protein
MAEPEGLIIDAARQATAFVSRLWDHDNNVPDNSCTLSACRQRLEFLLSAVHGHAVSLRVAQTPPPPSALSRLFGRIPRHLIETRPLPANDGAAIFLPMQLDPGEQGELSPHHSFRLLALQQAGRARRQAQQMVPADVIPPSLALALKPEDSLGWAVEMSMKISTRIEVPAGRYYHKEGAIVRLQQE